MVYRSVLKLGRWLAWILLAIVISSALCAILRLVESEMLASALEAGTTMTVVGEAVSIWVALFDVLDGLLILTTVVLWLIWFHRAYKNLLVLSGSHLDHSVGWAIWGWFVPILNLFRPYQITKEIWYESTASFEPDDDRRFAVVQWWWGIWILSSFYSRAVFRHSMRSGDDLDALLTVSRLGLVEDVLIGISAFLAFQVVREITHRQESRHNEDFIEQVFG